jgi:hypothetical protein
VTCLPELTGSDQDLSPATMAMGSFAQTTADGQPRQVCRLYGRVLNCVLMATVQKKRQDKLQREQENAQKNTASVSEPVGQYAPHIPTSSTTSSQSPLYPELFPVGEKRPSSGLLKRLLGKTR